MNKVAIIDGLRRNHDKFVEFVRTLDEHRFSFAPAGKWNAGQQLDHLVRSAGAVQTGLMLPKIIPRLLFGKSAGGSRDYDEIVRSYQQKLSEGGKASGKFIPPSIDFAGRAALTKRLERITDTLCGRIDNCSETQLDEYRLPHPILGKLTFREMLYFTIYHADHHYAAVVRNLEIE